MLSIVDRVTNGVAFLDNTIPGWYDFIDIDKINICDGNWCILGQLGRNKYDMEFGKVNYTGGETSIPFPYTKMCEELNLSSDSFEYGFYEIGMEGIMLNELWKDAIRKRLPVADKPCDAIFSAEDKAWLEEMRTLIA